MNRTAQTADVAISYDIEGSGPPVLCIQGVGVIGNGWRPQVKGLADRFRLITFDNRGIGRSGSTTSALTIEAMANDALAILDAEGIDCCHVMGHSMGGLIAQHLTLIARRRVQTLSLLCTIANGRDATALSLRMMIPGLRARVGTRSMRRQGMLRMIMPDDYLLTVNRTVLATELQELFGRDLGDNPPIVGQQLRAMSRYDARPRLGELSGVPTLVMSGAHDPIAPSQLGRSIASAIEGARFVEFPQASHALPIQCANEVNEWLAQHWSSAIASSSQVQPVSV